jgi:hypothetical protein
LHNPPNPFSSLVYKFPISMLLYESFLYIYVCCNKICYKHFPPMKRTVPVRGSHIVPPSATLFVI